MCWFANINVSAFCNFIGQEDYVPPQTLAKPVLCYQRVSRNMSPVNYQALHEDEKK